MAAQGGNRKRKAEAVPAGPDTPITATFRGYEQTLTRSQDMHEALVKISRDITVASKRAIFTLHRCTGVGEPIDPSVAESLATLTTLFGRMVDALGAAPQLKFLRAVSPGIQEYVD